MSLSPGVGVRFAFGRALLGAAALLLISDPAWAQMCERPLCNADERYARSGTRDGRVYGVCESGPAAFPPLAESHRIVECPSGWTLDTSTGQCTDDGCSRGCGQTRPACPYGWTFQRQEVDAAGQPYVRCGSTSGFGYESHLRAVYCREGWRLIAGGQCQKECGFVSAPVVSPVGPGVVLRPDLVIKSAYLRSPSSSTPLETLIRGQSYLVCFTVANQGTAGSGPFRVSGGGLGVPTSPYQNQTALDDGRTRDGCLSYPSTPEPGNYTLRLTADSRNAVRESREDNNTFDLRVRVESLVREPKPEPPPGLEPPIRLPPGKLPVAPDAKPKSP